jgi:uncharacterized membrane protein
MDNLQSFNPSGIVPAVTGLIFYILIAISAFFSASTIYSLIKYSVSRVLAFIIALAYLMTYSALVAAGISILNLIK